MTAWCARFALVFALLRLALCSPLEAQNALNTIDNPGGGTIVYGKVDGATSEPAAMGSILHALHDRYGNRPQVGKVFQVKNTNSVAVFFTLVKKTQNNAPVAGLLIVSPFGPDHLEAALVTDDAARFGSTVNPMIKTLFRVWHPPSVEPSSRSAAGSSAASAPPAGLKKYVLPDQSAAVSLPDGWNVLPQSGGGTILAEGPNGESASLGLPYLAMNSADPRVQQTMRFAQGAGRHTSYAQTLYYPYGGDLATTFSDLVNLSRQKHGQAPASIHIQKETALSPAPNRCAHLLGQSDPQDGKGLRDINTIFCSGPLAPGGSYMNIAYHTAVPVPYADQERATMGAILMSYSVNQARVNQQAAALAAPAIEHIHEIGRQTEARIDATHAAENAHNAAVYKQWDANDRQSQAFSNYLLDQTVIQDNKYAAHGTVWNETADALVKSDPNRYEYVNTPNFWKGIDY